MLRRRWTADLVTPRSVWLPGLFNPQSFLTAVMQTTARRNEWPLDKTVIVTEVTKRQPEQLEAPSKEGAFIHGCAVGSTILLIYIIHSVAFLNEEKVENLQANPSIFQVWHCVIIQ